MSLRSDYERNGYVVVRGAVAPALADAMVERYEASLKPSRGSFLRQNTNTFSPNEFNEFGHVTNSFLDLHDFKFLPDVAKAALEIYFSKPVLDALTEIDGHQTHNLMQSMLFDLNTETTPHQDWWYLDTVPNGHLTGIWFALEDIHEEAGRFFVLPGSHRTILHDEQKTMPHKEWLARMRAHVDGHRGEVDAPALAKGDILLWNSGLIHGSLATKDPRRSRRSLTAHYIPSSAAFGNLFVTKDWIKYKRYGEHRYYANVDTSLKGRLLVALKNQIADNPALMDRVRRVQRVVRGGSRAQ